MIGHGAGRAQLRRTARELAERYSQVLKPAGPRRPVEPGIDAINKSRPTAGQLTLDLEQDRPCP